MYHLLKELSVTELYDLRDHIICTGASGLDEYTAQCLSDEITNVIGTRQLVELMRPMAKRFIEEQEEKRNAN